MIADIAGHAIQDGVEIIGYMNGDTHQHVTFQHVAGEDLYFEFDDQSNGGYNNVTAAAFGPKSLTISTPNAPGGTLTVTLPETLDNRTFVDARLAEILSRHGVEVTRA